MKTRLPALLFSGIFLLIFFSIGHAQTDTVPSVSKNIQPSEQAAAASDTMSSQDKRQPDAENDSKLTIMTEDFPPFNYLENGIITGISTEIVQEILQRLDMKNTPIKIMDWDTAYQAVLEKPDTVIYSLTKIREREDKFKWVGPIATNYWFLFSKKQPVNEKQTETIAVKRLDDAKKYSIGVQKQGAIFLYLEGKGFTNLVESVSNKGSAENFINGKVQLWGESELVAASLLRGLNKNPNILQKTYRLRKHDLYIGFNIKTEDSMVEQFQATLDQMKSDGTYDKIINKYYNKIYIDNVKDGSIDSAHPNQYTLNP